MESQALLDRYLPLIKQNLLLVLLASLGMIFFIYGLISLFGSNSSNDIIFEPNSENSTQIGSNTEKIAVDVEGAVIKPGVYRLNSNSILQDALIAAGGLASSADREYIKKNINLALKLTDGIKIYFPNKGEVVAGVSQSSIINQNTINASGLININLATIDELDTLSGIGQVTAQKIIDNRPYSSIDDLLSKKVVGQKVFEKIKDKIQAQ